MNSYFTHYIVTRFNVKIFGKNDCDEKWLKERIKLFETFTLPSLMKQTNQNYIWLLWFDINTPKKYYETYSKIPNIKIIFEPPQTYIKNNLPLNPFIITTRIDNDDAIHKTFIQKVQEQFNGETLLVDTEGCQYNVPDDNFYYGKYVNFHICPSPFISLIELTANCQTVLSNEHTQMGKLYPMVKIKEMLFLQVIHSDNHGNNLAGEILEPKPNKEDFYLEENTLENYAKKYNTDKRFNDGTKAKNGVVPHGFTKYYFDKFKYLRYTVKKMMEIGVSAGASIKMWQDFFPMTEIHGVDIFLREHNLLNSDNLKNERTKIFIGDQADVKFLKEFEAEEYDIVIDDGGHRMKQQQVSLGALFKTVKSGGYYVIEDLHTSKNKSFWDDNDENATTLHFLNELKNKSVKKSFYINNEDLNYVINNIAEIEIFDDIICFIKKV